MSIKHLATLALLLASAACQAQTCEALTAQIETKIRGTAIGNSFKLITVDASEPTSGRVVGSCGQGSKKIVYTTSAAASGAATTSAATSSVAAAQPGKPRGPVRTSDNILTECKDGTMAVGASCGR